MSSISEFAELHSDIPQIPLNDGPAPVVKINYTDDFTTAMNLFRGVLQSQEMSQRVLDLLWLVIKISPAHYTVWKHRRDVIRAIRASVPSELELTSSLARRTPKNFQLWHHRRDLMVEGVTAQDDSVVRDERILCSDILDDDSKNYHVWSHRKWLVQRYQLWDSELEYTEKLLNDDVFNNSAWNYRHFVLTQNTFANSESGGNIDELKKAEITRALGALTVAPDNESPLSFAEALCSGDVKLLTFLHEGLTELWSSDRTTFSTVPILWSLHDIGVSINADAAKVEAYRAALEEGDKIRSKFWETQRKC
eukprot:PhM_4_TR5722/c0_g1_i1/m.90464/K05955/FNTA; protein farnesyltransferase/geranylgeranyltransferase type-1 subunit alpha